MSLEIEGENTGLEVVEVKPEREDENLALPPWVGREISADPRDLNARLALLPFSRWKHD